MTRYFCLALIIGLLSGCAHKVEVAKFTESDLDKRVADVLPPQYVIDKKAPKVAILPFGEPANFEGRISPGVQEGITQIVSKSCGMQVVERSQAQRLFDEKKFIWSLDLAADFSELAQMAQGIDYVVVGSITNPSITKDFTPSERICSNGQCTTIQPRCVIKGTVLVNVRVLNADKGTILQSFDSLKGNTRKAFNVSGSSQCRVADQAEVINVAVADAVSRLKKPFIRAFPRYGYLYKTMTAPDGKRIAYINLGRRDGLKGGDEIQLIRYTKEVDRVKKTESLTHQVIADVKITSTDLHDDRSIIIIPEDYSSVVMPGLAVKTKYNGSWWSF